MTSISQSDSILNKILGLVLVKREIAVFSRSVDSQDLHEKLSGILHALPFYSSPQAPAFSKEKRKSFPLTVMHSLILFNVY